MTVADLLTDTTFLCLCREWEEKGRCPFWAIDYLLDHGLNVQAEGARYCVECPESWNGLRKRDTGPMPWGPGEDRGEEVHAWWNGDLWDQFEQVTPRMFETMEPCTGGRKTCSYILFRTPEQAMAAFLDSWYLGVEVELLKGVTV